MDYAFAPGTDVDVKMLQQLLRDRTDGGTLDTTLIKGLTTVADFIARVDTTATKPTGDLLLGSHGNDTGWMEIDLDAAAGTEVSYQVVKDANDDVSRRIRLRIPPDFYTQAGTQLPVKLLIRGCRVGQAPKFIDALKVLFGGQVPVVAPRHFLGVRTIVKTRGKKFVGHIGSFEYFRYSNEIVSKTELNRAQLLAAYRGKSFPQYNATTAAPNPIPDLWDTWLPKDKKPKTGKQPIDYTVSLGRTIDKFSILSKMGEFRHLTPKSTYRIANPPAAVKTLAGFKQALSSRPEFQAGWGPTGFPVHEQWGHKTFDEYFDSFTWTPSKKKNADPFVWMGKRHEYNVLLPVVQPPMTGGETDRLLYNYFPLRGSGGTAFLELPEGHIGLFYTTP